MPSAFRRVGVIALLLTIALASAPAWAQDPAPAPAEQPAPAAQPAPASGMVDAGEMSAKPIAAGLLLGFSTTKAENVDASTAFSMEIPVEYGLVVGPGILAPRLSLMIHAKEHYTAITIPVGLRYIMHVSQYPIYVYPLFDIGPHFLVKPGKTTMGWVRFGAGLSYLIHPMVELTFQPLGLGAVFKKDFDAFVFNFELGALVHF